MKPGYYAGSGSGGGMDKSNTVVERCICGLGTITCMDESGPDEPRALGRLR